MTVSAESEDWLRWVLTTSIPLCQLDPSGQVVSRATGVLVGFAGRRFLLSVEHAVRRGTRGWAIELGFNPNAGTEVYYLNAFAYCAEYRSDTATMRELDLCFAEVPTALQSRYEYRTPLGLFDQRPHHVFEPDLNALPSAQSQFAFAGRVSPEKHGPDTFVFDMVVYPGLRYLRSEDEIHIFQLPVQHPGHEAFKGCSGAPIVDVNKRVVALVTSGDVASNTIQGISLARIKPSLEFWCAQTRGA